MCFADEVYERLDTAARAIGSAAARIQISSALPVLLPNWFGLIWHIAHATVPLLEFCRSELAHRPHDEFSTVFDNHLVRHIEEERHHGDWLLEDMQVLGVPPDLMKSQMPPAPIAAMVGSQYYLVRHHHPAVVLGYSALLEGYPASMERVRELIELSGTPVQAWRTYKLHAQVDPVHRQGIIAILNAVPANPALRTAIIVNGLRTAQFYIQALDDLIDAHRIDSSGVLTSG